MQRAKPKLRPLQSKHSLSFYRLDWPRDAFLILALFSPRAPVRGALGAAFLRAARFTALRSPLSVMDFVFAMNAYLLSELNVCAAAKVEAR
jgi:hypothetical protein